MDNPGTDAVMLRQWEQEQLRLKEQLLETDQHKWTLQVDGGLSVVCGVDISFVKETDVACAAVVFLSYPQLEVLHTKFELVNMNLPYVSGFLAFREVDHLVKLYHELVQETGIRADVILVDGNGVLHPRGLGLASHLGILLGVPSVGIAKSFLALDGLGVKQLKQQVNTEAVDTQVAEHGFASLPIVGTSGRVWGAALRNTEKTKNPIYVSVGHMVSLDTAVELVRLCSKFRIPEPVRQADLQSRSWLVEHQTSVDAFLDQEHGTLADS